MDFSLTKELIDIQKAAGEFAKGEFDPDVALEHDEKQAFPLQIWKKAGKLGFIGVQIPEGYNGQGLGLLENTLITEAFCRQNSGIGMALALSDFGSELIRKFGNEDQKKRFLPPIGQGKSLITMACLEEDSSLTVPATTAKIVPDGFMVNGKKSFVPLGNLAEHLVVLCGVHSGNDPEEAIIIVKRNEEGVESLSMGEKAGMRMIPMDYVYFKGVKISKEGVIGQPERSPFYLREIFDEVRIETGAMGVGIAQGGLDMALEYSKKRVAFGRAIVDFDVIRNRLADMYADVEMARLITYKAAWAFDRGRPDKRFSVMSKMIPAQTACRVTHEALQIYGGQGYMKEGRIEQFYRDAKVLNLFLEPGHMQRNLLADEIAGKRGHSPREV